MNDDKQLFFEDLDARDHRWRGTLRVPKRPASRPEQIAALAEFERRLLLSGCTLSSVHTDAYKLRVLVRRARQVGDSSLRLLDLVRDPELAAAACCDDRRLDGKAGRVRSSTLATRRSIVRRFLRLMEDQIGVPFETLGPRFEEALHAHCEPPLAAYRYQTGDHQPFDLYTPSLQEFHALLNGAADRRSAFISFRDVAILMLLASTGLRVSSVGAIRGDDFYRLGDALWVTAREKAKRELQQVRISPEVEQALTAYVEECNRELARIGSDARVGFGISGDFWQIASCAGHALGGAFGRDGITAMVRRFSKRVCGREFGPHGFRRLVTRELERSMSRSGVADAMRWSGTKTLDKHYASAPGSYLPRASGRKGDGDEGTPVKARPAALARR